MPFTPSGKTATSASLRRSRSAFSWQARTAPMRLVIVPRKGKWKMKSSASQRTSRLAGCSRFTATLIITPSYGSVPEWFATSRQRPSLGMLSSPVTSTRKYFS